MTLNKKQQKIQAAAKYAYDNASSRWSGRLKRGEPTECLIESTDIFEGLDLVGISPSDDMEAAVEEALMSGGYYAKAREAYELQSTQVPN